MKTLIIGILVWLISSCARTEVVEYTYEEIADPVVVNHGESEELIGYQDVQVDTVFPYPGSMRALERVPVDEVTCWDGECFGRYSYTQELIQYYYDVAVRNNGTLPAYGVTAELRVRFEEEDEYDPYSTVVTYQTVELYMADILEPDWEIILSYTLDPNEYVVEFLGIQWDDYDTYSRKLMENPNHYSGLAKKGKSKKIKITTRKAS